MAGDCFSDQISQSPRLRQMFKKCPSFCLFTGVVALIIGFILAFFAKNGKLDESLFIPGIIIFVISIIIVFSCYTLMLCLKLQSRRAYNLQNTSPTSPTSLTSIGFSGQSGATGFASGSENDTQLEVKKDSLVTFGKTESEAAVADKDESSGVPKQMEERSIVTEIVSSRIADFSNANLQSTEITKGSRPCVYSSEEIVAATSLNAMLDSASTSGIRIASLPIEIKTTASNLTSEREREAAVPSTVSEEGSSRKFSESFSGASLISSESGKGLSPTDEPPLLSQSSSDTSGSFELVHENGPVPVGNNMIDRRHNGLPEAPPVQNHVNPAAFQLAPEVFNMAAVLAGLHNHQNAGPHNQPNVGPHNQPNGVQLNAAAFGIPPEEFDMGAALAGVYNQNAGAHNQPNPGHHNQLNGGVQLNAEAFGVAPEEFDMGAALAGAYNQNAAAHNQQNAAAIVLPLAELAMGAAAGANNQHAEVNNQHAEANQQQNAGEQVPDIQIQEEIPIDDAPQELVQGEILANEDLIGVQLVEAAFADIFQNNPGQLQ